MKKLYTLLLLLVVNYSFAQDLFENAWHLTYFRDSNGGIYTPPNIDTVVMLNFYWDQDLMYLNTNVCNTLGGDINLSMNGNAFVLNQAYVTLIECEIWENAIFEGMYFNFYARDPMPTGFTYSITQLGDLKILYITSTIDNSQAVYSSVPLSTESFTKSSASLYPNPAADFITIEMDTQTTALTQIEIYNMLGKLCKTESFNASQTKIDTKDLSGGLYIVRIKTDSETITKKFLKL
jgi:hypothetical protein